MQLLVRHVSRASPSIRSHTWIGSARTISLTGSIEKGIRDGQHSAVKHEGRYRGPRVYPLRTDNDSEALSPRPKPVTSQKPHKGQPLKGRLSGLPARPHEDRPILFDVGNPTSIPYTTASSVFVYGTFSVLAALKARRRKLYKLYRFRSTPSDPEASEVDGPGAKRARGRDSADRALLENEIHNLAEEAGVEIKDVGGPHWSRVLFKAAAGRPHNGLLLEASPLPQLPVVALSPVKQSSDGIVASVGWASQEDQSVNAAFDAHGTVATIPSTRPAHRYPFILLLDRITDTGNFGAIVRSAWFLGVDAILILEHGTAPISTNALKASAGALEYMPILHVKNERDFVKESRQNGWKFFAADAPESAGAFGKHSPRQNKHQSLTVEGSLLRHPCVLVLGNEGTGIRDFMRSLVDGWAGIPNARPEVGDIDSLNVSVAAALITQKFFDTASLEGAV